MSAIPTPRPTKNYQLDLTLSSLALYVYYPVTQDTVQVRMYMHWMTEIHWMQILLCRAAASARARYTLLLVLYWRMGPPSSARAAPIHIRGECMHACMENRTSGCVTKRGESPILVAGYPLGTSMWMWRLATAYRILSRCSSKQFFEWQRKILIKCKIAFSQIIKGVGWEVELLGWGGGVGIYQGWRQGVKNASPLLCQPWNAAAPALESRWAPGGGGGGLRHIFFPTSIFSPQTISYGL